MTSRSPSPVVRRERRPVAVLLAWLAATLVALAWPGASAAQPVAPAKPKAPATPTASPAAPKATERAALEERLAKETARLEALRAELKQVQATGAAAAQAAATPVAPPPSAAPKAPTPAAAAKPKSSAPSPATATPKAASALVQRPSLPAADVLYHLGRYAEARAVYEAAARQPKTSEAEHVWALLQAGNCCRRLGKFASAIAHFQNIGVTYPDNPFTKGHVAWALKTAQWEKRWQRLELKSGD